MKIFEEPIRFCKYTGAGSDFVLVDNTEGTYDYILGNVPLIQSILSRNFGIGGDGLIFLCKVTFDDLKALADHEHEQYNQTVHYDYRMIFYNPDGSESTFAGNGSRCSVAFAKKVGIITGHSAHFLAWDGPHFAKIDGNHVSLQLFDTTNFVKYNETDYFVDNGSPHFVRYVKDLKNYDIISHAREIRYDYERFPEGANVNFVEKALDGSINIRTYLVGVEGEVQGCGTGAAAVSMIDSIHSNSQQNHNEINHAPGSKAKYFVNAKGGKLEVEYDMPHILHDYIENVVVRNLFIAGTTKMVFEGQYVI